LTVVITSTRPDVNAGPGQAWDCAVAWIVDEQRRPRPEKSALSGASFQGNVGVHIDRKACLAPSAIAALIASNCRGEA
jgi:hypothetical protein